MSLPSLRWVALAATLAGCAPIIQPDASRLAPWTTELRASQPDDAFGAVYTVGRNRLVFVGAVHTEDPGSLTFRMIAEAYAAFSIDVVIVEGSPQSRGANDTRLLEWAASRRERDGRQDGGETIPAVRGAIDEGAAIWGGEPDDADIRDALLAQGVSSEDLLGFYTLRSVPQWMREQNISGADDARVRGFIVTELERNRSRLALSQALLPNYGAWSAWYERINGKPFGANLELEEVGPLADGRHGSNKIAAAISRARDTFLLEAIAHRLDAGESVLVAFGGSHLMILRPALDAMLGAPCYVGSDLASATARSC